jgi:molecular chaperone HtpG
MAGEENSVADVKKGEEFTYQAEMKQLLDLIIHSLYQHKDIFLRELISNASDALNKVRFRMLTDQSVFGADAELRIVLSADAEAKTLTISDSGIGMSREELIENLGTIARSGTKSFLSQLKEKGEEGASDLIGRFGVGFYSAFMVADKIVVRTRSAEAEDKAWQWTSEGGSSFEIEEIEKDARGTEITLHLNEENNDFTNDMRIKGVVKKYSNYVGHPIFMGEDQLNETTAIWTRRKSDIKEEEYEEFFKFVSGSFGKPLATIHSSVEGNVQYHALLYIPESASFEQLFGKEIKGIKLYSRKVFVHEEDTGLLPAYLRFVAGIVDSEDLPLNVSREIVQSNPVAAKISKALTNKILSEIESMAKNDKDKFKTFWGAFNRVFKEGLRADFERKDRIMDLLHYETSTAEADTLHTLDSYIERMDEKQPEIYYVSGDSRENALQNPKLEIFKKHNIEVLLFLDPVDEFVISDGFTEPKYKDKNIKEIDQADLSWIDDKEADLDGEKASAEEVESLIKVMKGFLGEQVADVKESSRLVNSPCALVADKDGMSQHMEKMMKMMNEKFEGSKRVLAINPKNAIIRSLAKLAEKDADSALLKSCTEQLLDGVMLLEGTLKSTQNMVERNYHFMEQALGKLADAE